MKVTPNGERSAFPTFMGPDLIVTGGLSKRELIAAIAAVGLLSSDRFLEGAMRAAGAGGRADPLIARSAVMAADALLAALAEPTS